MINIEETIPIRNVLIHTPCHRIHPPLAAHPAVTLPSPADASRNKLKVTTAMSLSVTFMKRDFLSTIAGDKQSGSVKTQQGDVESCIYLILE
jgi:hypothetical protein